MTVSIEDRDGKSIELDFVRVPGKTEDHLEEILITFKEGRFVRFSEAVDQETARKISTVLMGMTEPYAKARRRRSA